MTDPIKKENDCPPPVFSFLSLYFVHFSQSSMLDPGRCRVRETSVASVVQWFRLPRIHSSFRGTVWTAPSLVSYMICVHWPTREGGRERDRVHNLNVHYKGFVPSTAGLLCCWRRVTPLLFLNSRSQMICSRTWSTGNWDWEPPWLLLIKIYEFFVFFFLLYFVSIFLLLLRPVYFYQCHSVQELE